ncbi:MAG: hypothetical protein WCO45_03125 [Pseudanabaena sp. ELA607]|jgi:predicted nuclease with TOPRIM domain
MSNAPQKRIQPKLRSIPLRSTPSAIYIQMHQLANEKERLQQELVRLSERQKEVLQRLAELDRDLSRLEDAASENAVELADLHLPANLVAVFNETVKTSTTSVSKVPKSRKLAPKQASSSGANGFETMTIEY